MKRMSVAIFLFLLQSSVVPQRSVVIHAGFLKARDYLDMPSEGQKTYAMGLMDGFYMAPLFGAPDQNKNLVSLYPCVEGMKASQVAAIIEKYVKDHPEHWHLDLKLEAYTAMQGACP